MSEKTNTRSYEVLAQATSERDGAAGGKVAIVSYHHLGVVDAATADQAIVMAVESRGLPYDPSGRVIAVPQSNWNERQVEIRQQPVVEVGPIEGAQGSLEGVGGPDTNDPAPPPPKDPGMATN